MGEFLSVPLAVLTDQQLTECEQRVLISLYSFRAGDSKVTASTQQICERSRVRSQAHLSRITSQLQAKGWLRKKRLGGFGRVKYRLTIPN